MQFGALVFSWLADLAILLSVVALALAAAAKGRGWLLLLGLVATPIVWIYAAVRLAAPSSVWARRWYDAEKLDRARARYRSDDAGRQSGVLVRLTAAIFVAAWGYVAVRALAVGSTILGSLIVALATIGVMALIIGAATVLSRNSDSARA